MGFFDSLAGLFGGLTGATQSAAAKHEANQMNYAIARQTNAQNYALFQQQLKYNTDMWERNNEYNSPSAQAQRLRAAGLNPYLMMSGQGGIGQSASPAQGVNPPAMQSAHMEAYDYGPSFSAAGNLIGTAFLRHAQERNLKASSDKLESETRAQNIDNMTKNAQNLALIEEAKSRVRSNSAKSFLDEVEGQVKQATTGDSILNARLQNESLEAQTAISDLTRLSMSLDTQLKEMHLKNYDARFAAELSQMWSIVRLNNASTATEFSQQRKLARDCVVSLAQERNLKLQNYQIEALTKPLVDEANSRASRAAEEAENVRLFGTPNPVSRTEQHTGIGGRFGIGTSVNGYNNISSAKKRARENEKRSK